MGGAELRLHAELGDLSAPLMPFRELEQRHARVSSAYYPRRFISMER